MGDVFISDIISCVKHHHIDKLIINKTTSRNPSSLPKDVTIYPKALIVDWGCVPFVSPEPSCQKIHSCINFTQEPADTNASDMICDPSNIILTLEDAASELPGLTLRWKRRYSDLPAINIIVPLDNNVMMQAGDICMTYIHTIILLVGAYVQKEDYPPEAARPQEDVPHL